MANIYVRSTDGDDGESGATWALAKATLAGASAIVAAGDTVWVSQVHAESSASPVSFAWNGTLALPTRILCGNDAAEPPTALATTATVTTTGDGNLTVSDATSSNCYVYGIQFKCGSGATVSPVLKVRGGTGTHLFERCTFELLAGSGDIEVLPSGTNHSNVCKNCDFKFYNVNQSISVREATAGILGGAILAGTTTTAVFDLGATGDLHVEGFDLSNAGATTNMTNTTSFGNKLSISNSALPTSWSGVLTSTTVLSECVHELRNSIANDTLSRYQRNTQYGTITNEQTIVRSGGANDGVRQLSWKMVTNTLPEWNHQTLRTAEIMRFNSSIGSAMTATVELVHDSVTNLTNQQIWLDVQYLGTSGSPISSFVNDSSGDYLSTAADQTASSVTWDTTGMANPNKQKLSVTFTPQEVGYVIAVIYVAMASKTVYIDPKLEIT